MKNNLLSLLFLAVFVLMGCGEAAPDTPPDTNTDPEPQKTVDFHPQAAQLFESYTALEKEKLDFSAFENEEDAKTFYGDLEGKIESVLDAVGEQLKDRSQYLDKMKEDEGFSMQADLKFPNLENDKRIQVLSVIVGAYLSPEDEINAASNSKATAVSHVVYSWPSKAHLDSSSCLGTVKNSHKKEKEKFLRITKLDPTMASVHQVYPDGFHIEVRMSYEKPS
ncbi:MAG: hypothetical protein GY810_05135 [Aureispira sp.]|nr:hypothetical protein [Aureispira sp.]